MKALKNILLSLLIFTQAAPIAQAGKLQDADFKSSAELAAAGATDAQLLNDSKIYIGTLGVNKKFSTSLTDSSFFNAISPLTTKGDLLGFSTAEGRLGVGTDGWVLTADSASTFGFKWAAAAGGGGTPGGANTQVQYNNSGAFGGITGATTNGTTLTLVAPVLGTPASVTLTNATGLPLTTGTTGALPETKGGTNQTSLTTGDTLYASAANTFSKLAIGTEGAVQTVVGGIPQWITQGVPYGRYARLYEEQNSTTDGGTFTAGSFVTRVLNSEYDPGQFVTLSSNQFTLPAGTYRIYARAPGYRVDNHTAKLRNVTDSTDTLIGSPEISIAGTDGTTHSVIQGEFTITASKTFEIQHRSSATKTVNGLGTQSTFVNSIYTTVELVKVETASGYMATDWASYTPTFQGFGTVTNIEMKWRREGPDLVLRGKFTAGTVTAVEAQMTLPSGLTSAGTATIPSIQHIGHIIINNATGNVAVAALIEPSVGYITFGYNNSGTAGLTKQTGSSLSGNNWTFSVNARIPVLGWTQSPTGTYAKLYESQTSGTAAGGFTASTDTQRVLNVEEDADNIVSLSSNQFTLAAGTYRIKAHAPAFRVDFHKIKLRNVTDSTDTIIGTSQQSNSTSGDPTVSFLEGEFTITAAKTYELSHRCSTTKATNGLGLNTSLGTAEIYSVVEIWKIK